MSQSPFHGIFNAFQAGQTEKMQKVTPVSATGEESVPVRIAKKGTGQIAVDIYEQDDYYIIRALIAGVKMNDLDIEVEGKQITIKGKRDESDAIEKHKYFLQECFWGEFNRSVTLPILIDPKKVKATFSKDSILKIFIPKAEEKIKIVRVSES